MCLIRYNTFDIHSLYESSELNMGSVLFDNIL